MWRRFAVIAPLCFLALAQLGSGAAQDASSAHNPQFQDQLRIGAGHLERGDAEQAVRELKKALALDSQSATAHMLLAQAYLALRSVSMVAEAKAELQQALDLDPTLLWARFYLAKVYIDQGRYDRAKEELELGLEARPKVPHFLSLLGEVHRKLGFPDRAIELHKETLAVDPAMTPAYYYMALAYMDLKKEDEALAALEKSIASPYVAPEMYLTLGSLYARKKRYEEGEELCKKAVALDPSRPEAHINLAQLYNIRGASDQALEELRLALEGKTFTSSPYYQQLQADAFYETGRAYQAKQTHREAIRAYLTALDFNPSEGRTHRQLAEVYARLPDYPQALKHAREAEKLGMPVDPSLQGEIIERLGQTGPPTP